jgi:hypothetical protein
MTAEESSRKPFPTCSATRTSQPTEGTMAADVPGWDPLRM